MPTWITTANTADWRVVDYTSANTYNFTVPTTASNWSVNSDISIPENVIRRWIKELQEPEEVPNEEEFSELLL